MHVRLIRNATLLVHEDELEWGGVRVIRTGGRHGTGELGASLGPVSG